MTRASILDAIPHRPPFLFIDKVLEIDERRIIANRFIDPDSDFFRGHYPDHPVMPGVLICECCFQVGAILIAHRLGGDVLGGGIPVLTRITDARFRRMVRPGDTLTIEAGLDDEVENAFYMTGKASVEGANVVRVGFACMLAPAEAAE